MEISIGDTVATIVYSIGGRSELVTGTVTGFMGRTGGLVVVQTTDGHGSLCVERAKVLAS